MHNLNNLFKSRGSKDHFRSVKEPGTTPYWKGQTAYYSCHLYDFCYGTRTANQKCIHSPMTSSTFIYINIEKQN